MYTWDKEIFSIYFAWENLLLHFTSQFNFPNPAGFREEYFEHANFCMHA